MKLLITAGGGGHFAPALAVIEQLPSNIQVVMVGRRYVFEADKTVSFEYKTAFDLNIPFIPITTGRLQRKFTRHTLQSLLKVPYGIWQAFHILGQERPDIVMSFGGYVTVPLVLAAYIRGVPIIIHEQTLEAGLANKFAAHFASSILVSWEESKKFFPEDKVTVVGNPLRKNIIKSKIHMTKKTGNTPVIFITGGSLGSHKINILIEQSLQQLLKKYVIYHQTGAAEEFKDYERLTEIRDSLPHEEKINYHLMKFVQASDMGEMMQQSDIVISRSGMSTITELLYLKKPSLLIPLMHGQSNEQLKNASFMKQLGIVEILNEDTLSPDNLTQQIDAMIATIDIYKDHAEKAHQLVQEDAAKKIIQLIIYEAQKYHYKKAKKEI